MNETSLVNQLRIFLSKLKVLNFRNHTFALPDPKTGRLIRGGLCVGSSDIVGIKPIVITAEHLGMTIGQWVSIEVKIPSKKVKPGSDQEKFLTAIRNAGGIAGVATCEEEVEEILRQGL